VFNLYTLTVTCLNVANSVHFVFGCLAELAVTFADDGRFY